MAGYDPKQPRDKEGQWTEKGSSSKRKKSSVPSDDGFDVPSADRFVVPERTNWDKPSSNSDFNPADEYTEDELKKNYPGMDVSREGFAERAEKAAREAAGVSNIDLFQQRVQIIEKARNEAGLSKGQMQGWERVRISKDYGGGSGFIYELSEDANFARVHKEPYGKGKFLGYYRLSTLLPFE